MVPAGRIKWKGALVFVPGLLVATACAIVSAQRALPSVGWGDEAELQVLAWQGGLPHCTGYPLYTSIGFLGTRLLASDPARGLSLMSAVFGGSALVLLYLLVLALLGRRDWRAVLLGVLAQGAVGTSDTFTLAACIAEMYTLQWTLTLGVLLLVLTWHERARDSALYGAAFLVGAMFGNHITTVLLLPGLALFIGLALRDHERAGQRSRSARSRTAWGRGSLHRAAERVSLRLQMEERWRGPLASPAGRRVGQARAGP